VLLESENQNNKWWVLVAIGAGTFMSALDGSVVNTILPVVNHAFGQDVASVEWVVTIYLLVLSSLLLSFGRLGDLRGHKPVYVAGFGVFLIGSALCGSAPSLEVLIAFRALQALGAAMLSANSPAILTKNFPAAQRGQALGIQAAMTYLGLTAGPSLGGWLAQSVGWRSVFYINIPVGILALYLSVRFIPKDVTRLDHERFDLAGAGLFMAGLVALLLGLNQGHALGWTSWPIIVLLATGLLALAAFVAHERRTAYPMLDLTLFSRRPFSGAVASAVLNYICVYTILFLMPFYLIQGRQLNPAQAGLLLTAQPITMAIVAPLAGSLSDRIGVRLLTTLGMAFLGLGLFLLARLGPDSLNSQIVLALCIAGFGTGIFISPNTSGLMGSAPGNRQGIASGILATARNLGMVFGVGLSGAIFTTILTQTPGANTGLYLALQASFFAAVGIALTGMAVAFFSSTSPNHLIKAHEPNQ
jgi:EmrB/QacA subfamily drug resistance transporter